MRFRATFTRGDRSFPVTGDVPHFTPGEHGSFRFSTDDAADIAPGEAALVLANGEAWSIMIRSCRTASGGASGEAQFRVLGQQP